VRRFSIHLSPGTSFPEHTHGVDKIDAVVSGQFEIARRRRPRDGLGDWIAVPRWCAIAATVIGHPPVISLDAVKR
jgi:hypothetical protein